MIYLATPFTRYPFGIDAAFIEASRIAGGLVKRGLTVFSPIAHSYPLAIHGDINAFDEAFWQRVDAAWCELCAELYVALMDGWRESRGVNHEIQEFIAMGKPISFVEPATLNVTRVLTAEVAT